MIRALLAAAALLAAPAHAGPDRLSILLGSHHMGARTDFDARNPGLFLTWEDRGNRGLDLSLGAYRNSYGRGALAATLALPLARWPGGQAALFLGVALYPKDGRTFRASLGDLVPLGGLQLRHRHWFMQIIPSDGHFAKAIIAVGVTAAWGK